MQLAFIFNQGKRVDAFRRAHDVSGLGVCCLSAIRVEPDARRNIMIFGLLLSQLPHIEESRGHYDAMLSLQPCELKRVARVWRAFKRLVS